MRRRYGFSEYALHEYAKTARVCWIADHLDAVLAQTLATRAYQALNRVCVGEARRVRFKSRGRGLGSLENKRNDTGLRFVLQKPEEGNRGFLIWKDDQVEAVIDWDDELVTHGLRQRIKYARLVQRRASSERAAGADATPVSLCGATRAGRSPASQAEARRGPRHHRSGPGTIDDRAGPASRPGESFGLL